MTIQIPHQRVPVLDESNCLQRDWYRYFTDQTKQIAQMQADVTKLKTLMNTLIPGSFP